MKKVGSFLYRLFLGRFSHSEHIVYDKVCSIISLFALFVCYVCEDVSYFMFGIFFVFFTSDLRYRWLKEYILGIEKLEV